jgi:SpoVK/Ycf46/Vps4 family AAA+-type ATPase
MSDQITSDLIAALEQSPGNLALRLTILRMLHANAEYATAAGLFDAVDDASLTGADDRRMLAHCRYRAGFPDRALGLIDGPDADAASLILKSRVLLDLERRDEAREAYALAVAQNASLEDQSLKQSLDSNVRAFRKEGKPALTVISNDDTDDSEAMRLLEPAQEKITFADVGGLAEVKKTIHRKIVLPFQKPSLFQRFRKRAGGGILLYGPPGCGKTLLARATAGEVDAAFYSVAIADVLDMYIGESERKLHAIFEKARQDAPSVLFFDEIEALGGKRQYTREATSSKIVSQFLSEMDGFAKQNHGVLIIGATNVPWAVDSAFRRPGRFDRVVFIPPPDEPARRAILELILADRPVTPDVDPKAIAARTSGFSGADLRELVETAVDEAIEESIDKGEECAVTPAHFKAALAERKPTTVEWLTTARNYARYSNEAGQYDEVLEFLRKHERG